MEIGFHDKHFKFNNNFYFFSIFRALEHAHMYHTLYLICFYHLTPFFTSQAHGSPYLQYPHFSLLPSSLLVQLPYVLGHTPPLGHLHFGFIFIIYNFKVNLFNAILILILDTILLLFHQLK